MIAQIGRAVNPTVYNTGKIVTVVRNAAIGVGAVDVTVNYPDGGNDRSQRVVVDATAQFVPLPSYYLLGSTFQIARRTQDGPL